jgi:CheY-like chemotaxis protein
VSDTGIGIDKKDMPNIFDVFEQGNKRTERIRGGAGLGLGICKKLVDLFNGQIFVESKLHKGSTFSVQIPFKKSKLTKIRKKEKNFSLEDNLLSRKKILLADDDEHNLLLAEMILKGWDTDFILAKNGKEATGILKDKKFDLILLDIHMPKRSGVQVIKALRSSKNGLNHSTPALALTANVLKADLNRYLKAGFNGYVKKPYKETNLYSKICNILQLEPGNHNTTKIQKSSIDKSSRLNSFEIEELKNVSKGDKVFFNKMIDNFANNAETLLIAFNSGIENKDLEEIGEKAHKAIPSFRFFKLNNIAASLEEIEHVALKQKRFTGLPEIIGQAEIEIKSAIQQAKASKK